ncbi:MAG: hypothetical protein ACI9MC_004226, partial [Kiritimatiellia bacterium]
TTLLIVIALAVCTKPPEGGLLTLSPETPTVNDDLIEPIKNENDDVVSLRWAWFLHGNLEPTHTTDTVPATVTRMGQVWRVEITPNDGRIDGVMLFAQTTIINSPPNATVILAPASPTSNQDLVATVPITDNDGDDTSATREA